MFCAFIKAAKAACFRSVTIAVSYLMIAGGFALDYVDWVASLLAMPDASQSAATLLGADPKVIAVYAKVTGVIIAVSRLRGLIAASLKKSP